MAAISVFGGFTIITLAGISGVCSHCAHRLAHHFFQRLIEVGITHLQIVFLRDGLRVTQPTAHDMAGVMFLKLGLP